MDDKSDTAELKRIRAKINNPHGYGKMIEGVHTWDTADIFVDLRAVIQIARRAMKASSKCLTTTTQT